VADTVNTIFPKRLNLSGRYGYLQVEDTVNCRWQIRLILVADSFNCRWPKLLTVGGRYI